MNVIWFVLMVSWFGVSFNACQLSYFWKGEESQEPKVAVFPEGPIVSFWAYSIDSPSDADWAVATKNFDVLINQIGFTHLGLDIYQFKKLMPNPKTPGVVDAKTKNRLYELRGAGYKVSISDNAIYETEPGYEGIAFGLDGGKHSSNGHDLKYLDGPSLSTVSLNLNDPESTFILLDPSYVGRLWQNVLFRWEYFVKAFEPKEGDFATIDIEAIYDPARTLHSISTGLMVGDDPEIPPEMSEDAQNPFLQSSLAHFPELNLDQDAERANENFRFHWKSRGQDLVDIGRDVFPTLPTIFFDEELSSFAERPLCFTSAMPAGTGDAPSPANYGLPYLETFQRRLNGFPGQGSCDTGKPNWEGTIVWLSPTWSGVDAAFRTWDPKITQHAGYVLKQEKVKGVLFYPGPTTNSAAQLGMTYEAYWAYYLDHSQALVDGFVHGIDTTLSETCGDGMDNDGDGLSDLNDGDC